MNALFAAIEQSGLSVRMRDDPYAYFVALVLHAWGMAVLVGAALVLVLVLLVLSAEWRRLARTLPRACARPRYPGSPPRARSSR